MAQVFEFRGQSVPALPGRIYIEATALRALITRLLLLIAILGIEAVAASVLLDNESLTGAPGALAYMLRRWGALAVRALIGFTAVFTTFAFICNKPALILLSREVADTPARKALLGAHALAVAIFAALSASLYGGSSGDASVAAWATAGLAAVGLLALSFVPLRSWRLLVQRTGNLWFYSTGAAVLACSAGLVVRRLWRPASDLTFSIVELLLTPILSGLVVKPERMLIGTERFTVMIAEHCSGLEGATLVLVFGVLWLILFRSELRLPHALVFLPAGVIILFLLNSIRIAALILIGNAGAREIAAGGFHSQAGWITFNLVAFGTVIAARRVPWFLNETARLRSEDSVANPVAAYVVPFLAIIAAGMAARAASGTFEWVYSLRLVAAVSALWLLRGGYSGIAWKPTWTAPAIGLSVFVIWIALDRLLGGGTSQAMPSALAEASPLVRNTWIMLRVLGASVTVPIAEELAFRGFLLRRFVAEDFEQVSLTRMAWFPVVASSVLFGVMHGDRWIAGILAGALYAAAYVYRGRLGDAIWAHAITNAVLAAYVLAYDQWHLW